MDKKTESQKIVEKFAENWYKNKEQIIQDVLYGDDKEAFHTHMKILAKK